ncbi:MAG: TlpA disulfide reductase family protein [Steroidobacteraceae bacterium]
MRDARWRRVIAPLLAVMTLVGCGQRDAPSTDAVAGETGERLRAGIWRAVLALPGGDLPFGLELVERDSRWSAVLVNGSERTRVDEVTLQGDSLQMRMPGFENRLTATIDGDTLRGEVLMIKLGAQNQRIPLQARRGERWRFARETAPVGAATRDDYSGRWAIEFGDGAARTPGVAEFSQQGSRVVGTFLTPTGDHRFLAGDVVDGELWLSKFDGGHAFLYRLRLAADGSLAGRWWSGLAFTEAIAGRRDPDADLGDADSVTRMRDASSALDIRFPDLDGTMVSLREPRFAGKVIVIALAGSWCPNCHDEAAFLAPFYRQNRERGLEVVSLMFEQFGDFGQAAAATRRFRERYGIDYTTLIAGTSDKEDAATKLPQLNGVYAFPTTIFIDRSGKVRRIHTGFSGPATGDRHRKLLEQFESLVDQLLAETPDPAAARPTGS